MADHVPLKGYPEQSPETVALANEGKEMEERVIRYLEKVADAVPPGAGRDRSLALAKTHANTSFMWATRAIFDPQRIKLPEDDVA